MGKYTSSNPAENSTLPFARKYVRRRAILGLPSYGIFANAQGSQELVPESDFAANGIDTADQLCLLVKVADRPDRDDSAAVAAFDDYINVGQTDRAINSAPNLRAGLIAMIENENNKIGVVFQPGDAERKLASIPSVARASVVALEDVWNGA